VDKPFGITKLWSRSLNELNPPITTVEELSANLEELDPNHPEEIALLRALRDLYVRAPDGPLKNAIRIELYSITAWLGEGGWFTTLYGVQRRLFPEDLGFLDGRLGTTRSSYLSVGYAYALWQLDRRPDRARRAVDAALVMLERAMEGIHAGAIVRSSYIKPLLEVAFLMSGRAGEPYRRADLRDLVLQIALDESVSLETRRQLIEIALKRRGDFGAIELATLLPGAEHILAQSFRGGAAFIAASAHVARRLADRVAPDAAAWRRREASAYLALMDANPQAILYEEAATRAIALFRQLGDDAARLAVEGRYNEAIAQQTLHAFGGAIDLREEIAHERQVIARFLNNHGGMGIIAYLALRPGVIPSVSDVQGLVDSAFGGALFPEVAARLKRSADGRVIAHSSIGNENFRTLFVEQFQMLLGAYSRLAMAAFADGVASGQLDVNVLARFFSETWLGEAEEFAQQQGEPVRYDLVRRVTPGFVRLLAVYDGVPLEELIPVIDSLTPALELLLRTLSRRLGIPTIVARQDNVGRHVDEVESLGVYLHRSEVRRVLGEDLAMALDVILIEPFGYGIRDDIAHGLLFPQQYSLEMATLLAVAIIRIAAISSDAIREEREREKP
jgi:hypothetical protein